MNRLAIILPARNESTSIGNLLNHIQQQVPKTTVIVVDDCSDDNTYIVAKNAGSIVLRHPYPMGNGAAVKTGVRSIENDEYIVLLDADGQHNPADICKLIDKLKEGYDMVVGARSISSHASFARRLANGFYNRLASWMTGHRIDDLTSGFRAVRTERFREFLYLLPNGFSYPTTITMAFFRSGYPVAYVPIVAGRRSGASHIKPLRDGVRFLLIIFKVGTLYSPMKLFGPISLLFFTTGLGYYAYTFFSDHRFTNMSALLFTTAVIVFLIGLVSEQITSLHYSPRQR